MTGRTHWTRKDVGRGCGFGDNILATVHDPAIDWYWREVTEERGFFNMDFRARTGEVNVLPLVSRWAHGIAPKGYVMVEPHVKQTFSADNKDWGWERWQELVDGLPLPWLQCVPAGARRLRGVQTVDTPSFDAAVGVLAQSQGLVSTNGGLQYAAAALGLPAVIVWGSFAPPEVLGYDFHAAIAVRDPDGLGWRKSHPACRKAMQQIEVGNVAMLCRGAFAPAQKSAQH